MPALLTVESADVGVAKSAYVAHTKRTRGTRLEISDDSSGVR
jgi:hypothetical protein